ncbi:diacylglycerol kinase family protein [Alkalihalobacillus sp. TS-13]|uniref:diacylglycerol/lipid kinase family protein n=1 Tax=Alkalihalobacillus sp. TS-13 TaxID=2842455 RepID=UPI001C88E182|nr:YegS/Rv2252/BmrU family lipid kinase [Alkalihalobacillus sp. TS-13]
MSTFKKATVIYNPGCGKRKNHKHVPRLLHHLTDLGFDLETYSIEDFDQVDRPITDACRQKVHSIFILGGDGTVNRCIQTISTEGYRPNVGIIPLGTSNEFAKYLGMPNKLLDTIPLIGRQTIKPIDIGKIGNRYFGNIAAAGWLTDITYNTSPTLKSWLGELAYCLSFFRTYLFTKQTSDISITLQKEVLQDLSLFLIMNGNALGPFERLIDSANRKDGHFHLVALHKEDKIRLFFSLLCKMVHLPHKTTPFKYQSVCSVELSFSETMPFNLDGEQVYLDNFSFEVLPSHLNVYTSN